MSTRAVDVIGVVVANLEKIEGAVMLAQRRAQAAADALWIGCPVRVTRGPNRLPLDPWPFAVGNRGEVVKIEPGGRVVRIFVKRGPRKGHHLNLSPLLLKPLPSKRKDRPR